jgi:hypothetical protein
VKLPCGEGGGERGCGRGEKGEATTPASSTRKGKEAGEGGPGPGGVGERGRFRLRVVPVRVVRCGTDGGRLPCVRGLTHRTAPHRTGRGLGESFWGGFHDIFSARAPVVHTTKTC